MPGKGRTTGIFGFLARPGFHLTMVFVWFALLVPTLLWLKSSILWVAAMSLYANCMGHWSAYQGARAERASNGDK